MREVAILGAGELGGATAHVLARRDVVRSIRLIDEAGSIAAGKALDIAQAAPIENFSTQMSGTTDIASAAGAAVIVLADRSGAGEWNGDEGARLLKRLSTMAPRAVMLCAGASAREMIDRAVRELRVDRTRVFGSASEALASGARALCALAANGSPRDVALSLVGSPPSQTVLLWEHATVGGIALTSLLAEPERQRLARRIAASWPPGPYALASAAVAAIDAMSGRTRRTLTCFVGPDTSMGERTRTVALPVRLGAAGIERVMVPELSAKERAALQGALEL
jgi:malate dehydrogenase